jgi:hypothetical protein
LGVEWKLCVWAEYAEWNRVHRPNMLNKSCALS